MQQMTEAPRTTEQRLPPGSYPAMLTAFHDDGAIDWEGVDRLTDHCIETGAAGIFACGLSAEVLWMNDDEKTQLAERVITRTAGRAPIVAAAISAGSIEEQAQLIRRVNDAGADAVAIGVCQLAAEEEDEQTWIERAETLVEQIPADVQLAMYECPLPYHRLLGEEAICWAAASGRFSFLKDTCCSIDTIRARHEKIGDSTLQLFNANTATLLESLQVGFEGFCGIGANFMPELYVWICKHFDDEPKLAAELHHFLDSTLDLTEDSTYPASAKNYMQQRGLNIGGYSRKVPDAISAEAVARLAEMLESEREWLARING